ncbi:MAG: GNAT family N-acetyltransferase [Nocardioidaceae bacterium]
MSRATVTVRSATTDDAEALVVVWGDSSSKAAHPRIGAEALGPEPLGAESDDSWLSPQVQEATAAIGRVAADPSERLLVAEVEGTIVGAVHLRRGPISPVSLLEAVFVSHLHVLPLHRRRGVASALLGHATAWADEKDTPHLMAGAPANAREANRFLARLGFCQVAVIRGTPVSSLRGRLAGLATGSPSTGRLIARRRSLRRRDSVVGAAD